MTKTAAAATLCKPVKLKQVHFTLQGKGGVGKSFISSIVAQYLRSRDEPVIVIDTDPINATLSGYKALNVQRLELMKNGSLVTRNFDSMMEQIIADKGSNFVIDNGASSFITLSHYLIENDIVNMLTESGKQVYIHTVITAGQALLETLAGFGALAAQMPEQVRIVVWLNEFMGEIVSDGKTFEEMNVYLKNKDRVHGIVCIEERNRDTYGEDIKRMNESKLTFAEINHSPEFGVIAKSRLHRVRQGIYQQMGAIV